MGMYLIAGVSCSCFLNKVKTNEKFEITHEDMTRFNITLDQGVDFVEGVNIMRVENYLS